MNARKVSVLIACRDGAGFIEKALGSVLSQTLRPEEYEVILVNDASRDSTEEVLRPYRDHPNFRYLKNSEGLGLARTCNRALEAARGDYVVRLDADDTFEPALLEELCGPLDRKETDFVSCDRRELNLETGQARLVRVRPFNLFRLIAIGTMMRRDLLLQIGGWRDLLLEEYDLYLRYLSHSRIAPIHIPRALLTYTIRSGSMTSDPASSEKGWKQLRRIWPRKLLERSGAPI